MGVLISSGSGVAILTEEHLRAVQCVAIVESFPLYSALVTDYHAFYEICIAIVFMAIHIRSAISRSPLDRQIHAYPAKSPATKGP